MSLARNSGKLAEYSVPELRAFFMSGLMNQLYWIVRHPRVYAGLSAVLVLLMMALAAMIANHEIESELNLSLLRTLESYAGTLEGGTTNSRAMGSAILFGQENQEAKQLALGTLPPGAPGLLAKLDMMREMYTADAVYLTNRQGRIVAISSKSQTRKLGHDLSFRPYIQQALRGLPSVYPAVGILSADRGIFLSAPLRAGMSGTSAPVGAVVVRIGAEKLDMLLKSWPDGIAVLLSPQGVVFAASRDDWVFRATGQMSAERLTAIRRTRQFGNIFEQAPPATLPFTLDMAEASIDGKRYAVSSQQLEWNDPEGDWQLAFLERRDPWWTYWGLLGLFILSGLISAWVLFWLFTLTRNSFLLESMNAQLRHNDALLYESQLIAGLGFYTLNIPGGSWESSDILDILFGIGRRYERSVAGWLALVHPDDRAMMERYFAEEVLEQGQPFDKEYRIVRQSDQAVRWVHGLGRLERNELGQLVRMQGTIQDITQRKRGEEEVHQAMRELELKELAKSRFLAAAGHDLRQPLAAANLFIDALKSTSPNPSQQLIIQRLDQSMETFNGLLDALLNISRLDAGIIKPEYESIAVDDLIIWLENSFAGVASEKKLRFKLYFPLRERLAVRSDCGLLQSVLMNLVSNAIKFTAQGAIMVSARKRGEEVLFQVWDTGIGITAENIEHIYDEFYQINNPQRDRTSGLGLGLAITKRALALLSADIACRSHPGRGTVFSFRLPRAKPPANEFSLADIAALPGSTANDNFAHGKRFVVVEDDAIVGQAIVCVLEGIGGRVQCYPSAEDALRDMNTEYADYFIADYMLSGKLNGIQLLKQIRQRIGQPIHAVLMTGDTSPAFLAEAAAFPWKVLHKPVNLANLLESLRERKA